VDDPDGRRRLELTPRYDRHSRTELGILGTEVHQVFGTWSFQPDEGPPIEFSALQGFAEESRSRW
jgi:hypothetical protein